MSNKNKTQSKYQGIVFLEVLYHLIHVSRIHKDNNQLVRECLSNFKGVLDDMTREEDLKIQLWRGRLHIGEEKLPYKRESINIMNEMTEYFSTRALGGLNFSVTSKNVLPADLLKFIRLLDVSVKHEDPPDWLEQELAGYAVPWVWILRKQDDNQQNAEEGFSMKRYDRAKKTYFAALDTVKEVADKASRGIAGVRKARHLAQTIVDLICEDTSLMLGLATIKDYDDYTYTHSVNVSLLATCLGRHIGLSKVSLEHLSVCGLFHDLGKVGVSKDVLLKKGELSAEESKNMQRHPLVGVRKILRLNADKVLRSRIIIGPFEHHLNLDLTGYPKTHFMKKLSLLGKILRITDVYEALTSERAYRPRAFTPDEALRKMWSEAGKSFDPILLKSFIDMMGIYPIGSVVELNNGQIALVMDYPDESQKAMPLVLILVDEGEGSLTRGEMIRFSDKVMEERSTRLNIVRGVQPTRSGVQVAQFFLQEK